MITSSWVKYDYNILKFHILLFFLMGPPIQPFNRTYTNIPYAYHVHSKMTTSTFPYWHLLDPTGHPLSSDIKHDYPANYRSDPTQQITKSNRPHFIISQYSTTIGHNQQYSDSLVCGVHVNGINGLLLANGRITEC